MRSIQRSVQRFQSCSAGLDCQHHLTGIGRLRKCARASKTTGQCVRDTRRKAQMGQGDASCKAPLGRARRGTVGDHPQ